MIAYRIYSAIYKPLINVIDKLAQDVNRDRAAMLRVEQVQQAYQQLLAKLPKSKPISDEIAVNSLYD